MAANGVTGDVLGTKNGASWTWHRRPLGEIGHGFKTHNVLQQSGFKEGSQNSSEKTQKSEEKSMWDCDSSLYDSFELLAFSRQLNRALTGVSSSSLSKSTGHDESPLMHPQPGCFRSLSTSHSSSLRFVTETDCRQSQVDIENTLHSKQKGRLIGSLRKVFRAFRVRKSGNKRSPHGGQVIDPHQHCNYPVTVDTKLHPRFQKSGSGRSQLRPKLQKSCSERFHLGRLMQQNKTDFCQVPYLF